jgi:hypothetical protein
MARGLVSPSVLLSRHPVPIEEAGTVSRLPEWRRIVPKVSRAKFRESV